MLALDMLRGAAGAQPTLDLNFVSGTLDSRVTFTRASSATRVNASGVLEVITSGNPRFTYDPVTHAALGLLIEEQRTNLLLWSEAFDNAAWTLATASVTANAAVAPDGTSTADKLVEDSTPSTTHRLYGAATVTTASHTLSVYVKAAGRSIVALRTPGGVLSYFNLSAGTVGTVPGPHTASIAAAGNGWFRCAVTWSATAGSINVGFDACAVDGSSAYTGDGTSGIYLWGAQLEAGAFATSYIPTTSASVTRAADNATMTGSNFSSWFNAAEGTFVADMNWSNFISTTPVMCDVSDATGQNQISLYLSGSSVVFVPKTAGVNQAILVPSGAQVTTATSRAAGSYKVNDFRACSRGGTVASDSLGDVPTGLTQMGIGRRGNSDTDSANAPIARLRYYPVALTNAQLQALTT